MGGMMNAMATKKSATAKNRFSLMLSGSRKAVNHGRLLERSELLAASFMLYV